MMSQYQLNTGKNKMKKTRQYVYPKNWFKHNLIPVPTGFAAGNCSACIFRNYPNYCNNMACIYIDSSADYMESVYWIGRETHANIATWTELNNFFNNTPTQRIRDISNAIMTKVVKKERLCRETQNHL